MRYIFIVSFILCSCRLVSAQNHQSASITIKILDDEQKGIEGATASLLNSKDSSIVKINISEKDGSVLFENIKEGGYIINATSLGYKKKYSAPFIVEHDHQQIVLTAMLMEHVTGELKEVNIQEKKPFIEKLLDRTVINVNNSIVSAGSSALEVLSRAPGVLVNQDDVISLKGKQGVIVMIDDKPTYLSATDLANLLRSTPASSIDKIELITNPSAKYDAAGSAGIINIKLKKDQRYGVNGSINSSIGQGVYGKLNEGISLNYRKNNINIFGNYNYTYRENFNHLILDRRFLTDGAVSSAYKQNDYLTLPLKSHLAKAGFDYTVTKKTTIGMVFNGLFTQFDPGGENSSDDLDSLLQKVSSYKTSTQAKNKLNNYSGNFNFRHTIDTAGQEITADLDYARYGNNSTQIYDTRYFALDGTSLQPDNILQDNQTGALDIYSIKVDYVKPLKKQAKIEAGFKSSYVREDNNLATYNLVNTVAMFDTSKSNHFIYDENINAAYLNYNKDWQKYKLQVGVRAEQTIVKGDQLATNNNFRNSYIQLFPSIFLSDKIDEQNDLTLSVGRRIDRPTYKQLNPFKFYLDPSTYIEGNPFLKPQLTIESDFTYTYKQKYSLTFTYSRTDDNIISVLIPSLTEAKVTIQTDKNLALNYYYALSMTLPIDVTSWWTSTNNVNCYYSKYVGNLQNNPLNTGKVAFDANTNNSFKLGKLTSAELNVNYVSSNVYGYFATKGVLELSTGIQRTIFNKKGTIKLNVSDFIHSSNLKGIVALSNYYEQFTRLTESRVATIAFTYHFGSNKIAPSARRTGGAEDEKKRASAG